jgi:hypothetical protein
MRQAKAIIYLLLGGMVAWGYGQRGELGFSLFVGLFTLLMVGLTLSSIGRLRIRWDDQGVILSAFPRKPRVIPWGSVERVSLDHLGYHIRAREGRFTIRKRSMPEDLLRRLRAAAKQNAGAAAVGAKDNG